MPPSPLSVGNLDGDRLFQEFNGALTENFVAQELWPTEYQKAYWTSPGKAEVNFLLQSGTEIIPIEVKAVTHLKSKSLQVYQKKYSPTQAFKVSQNPLAIHKEIVNLPLYLLTELTLLTESTALTARK